MKSKHLALSLTAALRDQTAKRAEDRLAAVESLASAYLTELDPEWPEHGRGRFRACDATDIGNRVREALLSSACDDADFRVRARAHISLGLLGEIRLLDLEPHRRLETINGDSPESEGPAFAAEGWVLGLSQFAANLRREQSSNSGHPIEELAELSDRLQKLVAELLQSAFPGICHSACSLAAELGDPQSRSALLDYFDRYAEPDALDEGLLMGAVVALSRWESHSDEVLRRVAGLLEDSGPQLRTECAALLAAARDPRAVPALDAALESPATRAQALEALAVLGPSVPEEVVRRISSFSSYQFWPNLQNIRALYAEAKLRPEGSARGKLQRIARSWRPLMRDAAGQALALLETEHSDLPSH